MPLDVQFLSDYVEIRQLNALYNRHADGGDGERYASLYTHDGEFHISGDKTYRGRTEIAAIAAATTVTIHVTTEPEISVEGDMARQRVRMLTCVSRPGRNDFVATGWYLDELHRTPDGWRYRRRRVELDLPVGEVFEKMGMVEAVRSLGGVGSDLHESE